MDYKTLEVTVDQRGVVSLALNVVDKRNALSAMMIDELTHFARTVADNKNNRVVVLSGNGKLFCAGGDLNWMKAQIKADRSTRITEAKKLADMLRALNEMPLPLIGKIHGGAFGGGVGLACICDTVVAAQNTKFGFTETKLGLIPATIGPYVIARLGEGCARQVFMSATIFDATEALKLGVVSKLCSAGHADELNELVETEVAPYLSAAPSAVAQAKALARELGHPITDETIQRSIERLADIWEGTEAIEGIDAFFAKRDPSWLN